jgi:hypothetical protein
MLDQLNPTTHFLCNSRRPSDDAVFLAGNAIGAQRMHASHITSTQMYRLSEAYWYFSHVIPVATVLILFVMLILLVLSQYFPRFATGIIVTTALVMLLYTLCVFLNDPKEVFE